MNDYHSILKRTLAALPSDSVEMRLRVYAKARSMIREQFDPDAAKASSGAGEALAERMRALEAAIARIEAERSDPEFGSRPAAFPASASAPSAAAPQHPPAAPASPFPSPPARSAPRESPQARTSPSASPRPGEARAEARKGGSSAARWIGGMAALALIAVLAGGLLYMQRVREEATPAPGTSRAALEADPIRSASLPEAQAPKAPQAPTAVSGEAQAEAEGQASLSGNRSAEAQDLSASLAPDSAGEAPAQAEAPSASGFEAEFPVISEEAFLYELRASQEGEPNPLALRSQGKVVWSLRRADPPGASASGASPSGGDVEIRAIMEIPTRQLRLELGIRRNSDPALSASHVIELAFSSLPDPVPIRVGELARFVMKADEQDRGESLIAVPVRIDANHFMIALNNLPQARSSNERLLFEREWIDVPMIYEDETRALVTLRKGRSGGEVFRLAFEEWGRP